MLFSTYYAIYLEADSKFPKTIIKICRITLKKRPKSGFLNDKGSALINDISVPFFTFLFSLQSNCFAWM